MAPNKVSLSTCYYLIIICCYVNLHCSQLHTGANGKLMLQTLALHISFKRIFLPLQSKNALVIWFLPYILCSLYLTSQQSCRPGIVLFTTLLVLFPCTSNSTLVSTFNTHCCAFDCVRQLARLMPKLKKFDEINDLYKVLLPSQLLYV